MAVAGITLLAIGSIGICAAVALEVKYNEPIYRLLMKIFPWFIGVGGMLLGVSMTGE